ncbi:MAG TPA: aromatic ring-hydroxylating dioxygenase subunit alpha [Pyrinomonadaceae bacterium]|jgi:choline monooxygenase
MSIFDINPDIRRAETLSSDFYTDERYFDESKEKIFARSWQLVGMADEINNLKPHTLLENFLDEPLLISRTESGFHCLSNVCTHRGKILIERDCRANLIRCGYHGRRFALDGKFLSMPEFETVENFPSERDNLPQIPFGIWEKFLFASINPIAPLDAFLAEMREKIQMLKLENLRFAAARDYEVKAHWTLYCENYLEGFHIPFVHQSLNEAIDFASYTTETFRFSSLQKGIAKTDENIFDLPGSNEKIAAFYFFIFPNLMFNFYPWGLSVNVVKPVKPDLTIVSYLTFVADESKLEKGAGADLNCVELEDQMIVESVQKGLRSRFYSTGRYSPTREQGTHHFHRLICEFMQK